MKTSLLLIAVLFLAISAQAQSSHVHMQNIPTSQASGPGGLTSGSSPGNSTIGSAGRALEYQPPRNLLVGYAKNDGNFVPSTYMNYTDALALGKQQMATGAKPAQSGGGPSLGEVARSYKIVKVSKLQAGLVQGDSGKLEACDLNGSNCHRLGSSK